MDSKLAPLISILVPPIRMNVIQKPLHRSYHHSRQHRVQCQIRTESAAHRLQTHQNHNRRKRKSWKWNTRNLHSQSGLLCVAEILNFVCEHFPYFKMASIAWKNAIRHTLSTRKCFKKFEIPGWCNKCLWKINPSKIAMMEDKLQLQSCENPTTIRNAMAVPEYFPALLRGDMKHGGLNDN